LPNWQKDRLFRLNVRRKKMKVSSPGRNIAISLIAALTIGGIALIVVALSGADLSPALRGVAYALLPLGLAGLITLAFYHLRRKYTMPGLYWLAAGLATGIGLLILLLTVAP
jgi:hypothetical protein